MRSRTGLSPSALAGGPMDHPYSLGPALGHPGRGAAIHSQLWRGYHDHWPRVAWRIQFRSHALYICADPVRRNHGGGWSALAALHYEAYCQSAVLGGIAGANCAGNYYSVLGSFAGAAAAGGDLCVSKKGGKSSGSAPAGCSITATTFARGIGAGRRARIARNIPQPAKAIQSRLKYMPVTRSCFACGGKRELIESMRPRMAMNISPTGATSIAMRCVRLYCVLLEKRLRQNKTAFGNTILRWR